MATPLSEVRAGAISGMAESPLAPFLSKGYTPNFDPAAYHAMQERDNQLIRDEIMHGYASRAFIYSFEIQGKKVHGVSVIGARELASQYKGIKARIVATVEKKGALFIFRSFSPLNIETRVLPELADDDDYYECVMEVSDLKTGNTIEVRKKENRTERKRDGGYFIRPHYDVICESKAYRNGVLSILPQGVIKDFEAKCLASGGATSEKTIDQLRDGAIAFAAKHGVAVDRRSVQGLAYAELLGLGNAAAAGKPAFIEACAALGVMVEASDPSATVAPSAPEKPKAEPARVASPPHAAASPRPTGEPSEAEKAAIRAREMAESTDKMNEHPDAAGAQHQDAAPTRQRRAREQGAIE